jgi:hypothetical protein
MPSNIDGVIYQETIRSKGVPLCLDAVRAENKAFIISGDFIKTAALKNEWQEDVEDPDRVVRELKACPVTIDFLRFWQRIPEAETKYRYYKEWRYVAAIPVTEYKHWLQKQISPKARNKIKKSAKFGVIIEETELTDELMRGIMDIFNQAPVRRGKRFWHYGKDFETVKKEMSLDLNESIFITAYYGKELIGFIKLLFADRYAMLTLILDKIDHRDKAPMNGMIAKAVEICAGRKVPHIVYMMWRRGGHGDFQESNGFERIPVPEYFVPLTFKGAIALRLGLHRGVGGLIPEKVMVWLLALRAKWHARKKPVGAT